MAYEYRRGVPREKDGGMKEWWKGGRGGRRGGRGIGGKKEGGEIGVKEKRGHRRGGMGGGGRSVGEGQEGRREKK